MLSDHGESIYNIIPPKPVPQEKPPMHKSKFNGDIPPTASTFHTRGTTHPLVSNLAGNAHEKPVTDKEARDMGRIPGSLKPDPADFRNKSSKMGRVKTLAEVKREEPHKLAPAELKPRHKPAVPRRDDEGPVMNLVTSKNFIVANAVETILAAPKKVSQGAKDYLHKEDYGKVPKYLSHIKRDIESEYDYIRQLQQAQDDQFAMQERPLDEAERKSLIEGLKSKWEQVNTEYQATTHLTKLDTYGKIKRKEKYEAELSQIEKDIEKLSRKNIIVDTTQ
mmetsp:Transcript_77870/g.180638  ORF Transcript_77870/g.180638 Transcript_77870/m.180638 type:complete len:278 (-) Transcript_77870:117-950(-)